MSHIREWLEATACPSLDWVRDEQVGKQARSVVKAMRREGHFFSFRDTTELLKIPLEDLVLVKERVYELTLKHVMEDFRISECDRGGLRWIAHSLHLEPDDARRIELRVGRKVFEEYLAFAIAGGYLTGDEVQEFRRLAVSLDVTTRQLLLGYLAESGEQFLQMIAEAVVADGAVSASQWGKLIASVGALGLDEGELVRVLKAQIPRFAEKAAAAPPKGEFARLQRLAVETLIAWLGKAFA